MLPGRMNAHLPALLVRARPAAPVALCALVVIACYADSLSLGWLLDDFNHAANLRETGWRYTDLVEAAHLGDQRRRVQLWWQPRADQYFYRPLAMAVLRAEYVLGGWRPGVAHAVNLALHTAAGALVAAIAARFLPPAAALLAAVWFLIHPAHHLTVRWIACQNELLATTLILAALLLWLKAAAHTGGPSRPPADRPHPRHAARLRLAATLAWTAALGCRESSVIFPLMALIGEALTLRGLRRCPWRWYLLLAALLVAYLVLRSAALNGLAWPGQPYIRTPAEVGFLPFALAKIVYYTASLVALLPVVGFVGTDWLMHHPAILASGTATLLIGAALLWRLRASGPTRAAMLWSLAAMLPFLPVFASTHHLYLPAAGMAIVLAAILTRLADRAAALPASPAAHRSDAARRSRLPLPQPRRSPRPAAWTARLALVVILAGYATAMPFTHILYARADHAFHAASQVIADTTVTALHPDPGDHLYFVNLPLLAFNTPSAIQLRRAGPVEAYALTLCDSLLACGHDVRVEIASPDTIIVRQSEPPYFAGPAGRHLLAAARRSRPLRTGETFHTPRFTATITDADESGVRGIAFRFREPLDPGRDHIIVCSRRHPAYPLPPSMLTAPSRAGSDSGLAAHAPRNAAPRHPSSGPPAEVRP